MSKIRGRATDLDDIFHMQALRKFLGNECKIFKGSRKRAEALVLKEACHEGGGNVREGNTTTMGECQPLRQIKLETLVESSR